MKSFLLMGPEKDIFSVLKVFPMDMNALSLAYMFAKHLLFQFFKENLLHCPKIICSSALVCRKSLVSMVENSLCDYWRLCERFGKESKRKNQDSR